MLKAQTRRVQQPGWSCEDREPGLILPGQSQKLETCLATLGPALTCPIHPEGLLGLLA